MEVHERLCLAVQSPENPMFRYMSKKWDKLDKSYPKVLGPVEEELKRKKAITMTFLRNFLKTASPSADYREVAEPCLILLGTTGI